MCQGVVRQYQQQIDDDLELIEEEPESHEPQILRHTVLLILLLCSMFVVSNYYLIIIIIYIMVCTYLDSRDIKRNSVTIIYHDNDVRGHYHLSYKYFAMVLYTGFQIKV